MGDVISLSEWKEKLEKIELDALSARVSCLIDDLREDGLLEEPQPWYPDYQPTIYSTEHPVADDADPGIHWDPGPGWASLDGYLPTGMASYADITLEPNTHSCSKTLAWVSYILADMGRNYESTMIDEVIERLEEEDD
jgi:hypothetical protein